VREGNRAEYSSLVRFAYCKRESVLDDAVTRLGALKR